MRCDGCGRDFRQTITLNERSSDADCEALELCERCTAENVLRDKWRELVLHMLKNLWADKEAAVAFLRTGEVVQLGRKSGWIRCDALSYEAGLLFDMGRFEESVEIFKKALSVRLRNAYGAVCNMMGLSRSLGAMGKTDDALAVLENAVAFALRHGEDGVLLTVLGQVCSVTTFAEKRRPPRPTLLRALERTYSFWRIPPPNGALSDRRAFCAAVKNAQEMVRREPMRHLGTPAEESDKAESSNPYR